MCACVCTFYVPHVCFCGIGFTPVSMCRFWRLRRRLLKSHFPLRCTHIAMFHLPHSRENWTQSFYSFPIHFPSHTQKPNEFVIFCWLISGIDFFVSFSTLASVLNVCLSRIFYVIWSTHCRCGPRCSPQMDVRFICIWSRASERVWERVKANGKPEVIRVIVYVICDFNINAEC